MADPFYVARDRARRFAFHLAQAAQERRLAYRGDAVGMTSLRNEALGLLENVDKDVATSVDDVLAGRVRDRERGYLDVPFTVMAEGVGQRVRLALALERASTVQPNARLRYLAALQGAGTAVVALDRIVAVHGADDYSEVEVADGRRLLHRKPLRALARELPAPFVRIHRSHIVNLDFASGLERVAGRWHVVLKTGGSLAVGRRAVEALRRRLL